MIDADGRVLAPGFIDVHTHYDVQLDWDPLATPSCCHGVTTVLTGNCGFTLAPAKPEDVPWLAAMLSRVEGMSKAALAAGFRFEGGSFGDFWRRHDGRLGVNAGSYVGHSAVRRFVMGEAASERAATPAEIAAMQELVRAAHARGRARLLHLAARDPRRRATAAACRATTPRPRRSSRCAPVLAEFDRGAIEFIPRSFAAGYDDAGSRAAPRDVPRLGQADRAERADADARSTRWAGSARSTSCARPARRACACTRSSRPTSSSCT